MAYYNYEESGTRRWTPDFDQALLDFHRAIRYEQQLPTKRTYGFAFDPDIGLVYWYRGRAYRQLAKNAHTAIGLTNRAELKASWQSKAKADFAKACSLDSQYCADAYRAGAYGELSQDTKDQAIACALDSFFCR